MIYELDRRRIMRATAGLVASAAGGVVAARGIIAPAAAAEDDKPQGANAHDAQMPDVTPPEDLMREHGVLNRVLLIYEATMRRFADHESFDPAIITRSAQIVREFVEDYHERNEETRLFPRFRQAGQMVGLVEVLYRQHQAGRRLTDIVLELAPASGAAGDERTRLVRAMQAFITMYRPHEAREDTELFPRLRSVVSANEFDAMADDFERDEQQKFGQDGFEMMVERVAGLERAIGINELDKFTPTSL